MSSVKDALECGERHCIVMSSGCLKCDALYGRAMTLWAYDRIQYDRANMTCIKLFHGLRRSALIRRTSAPAIASRGQKATMWIRDVCHAAHMLRVDDYSTISSSFRPLIWSVLAQSMSASNFQRLKGKGKKLLSDIKQSFSRPPSPNPSERTLKTETTPESQSTPPDLIQNASSSSAPPEPPEHPSLRLPGGVGDVSQLPKQGDPAPIAVDDSQSSPSAVSAQHSIVLRHRL